MSLEQRINDCRAQKKVLEQSIEKDKNKIQQHEYEKEAIQEAKIILQLAAKETQKNIEHHFSSLVTKALQIIFDHPYVFHPEFIERRNKTECDFWLLKDEEKIKPKFAVGGGVMDTIAFALRLADWKLEKSSPVIVLDEPFRNLSANLMPKAANTLRYLADELGLQMIISSHENDIVDQADAVFDVKQGNVRRM
jgi:ABC-type enterochelin transport system ATPase subunit